jgi:hypothetical protein
MLTAPLIANLFVGPSLVVRGKGSPPEASVLTGTYIISNEGNAPATKIEMGLVLQIDQRLSVMPNIGSNVVEEKSPAFLKNVRVEIERLSPGESAYVMVFPGPSLEKLDSRLANYFPKSGVKEIPLFSFVRSNEGPGKFNPQVPSRRGGQR